MKVLEWLKKEFNFNGEVSQLHVTSNGILLKQGMSLVDANITGDTTLTV
jgi:hypothetical protein